MYNIIIFTDITDNISSSLPIGAYKCAHVLRKNGYTCLVVSHLSDYSLDELKDLLDLSLSDKTLMVGFSSTFLKNINVERIPGKPTPEYLDIGYSTVFPQGKNFENSVISYIKQKNDKVKFIVGGSKTSLQYSNKNIDYAFIGFSESSIVNLADHLHKGLPLSNSKKNIFGVTIIDDRVATNYKFSTEDMVWLDTDIVNHKALPIEIGRGCIFRCKFCGYPNNGKKNLDFVKHQDILYNELMHNYKEFGVTNYIIVDDTFNDHVEKLESIRTVIKKLPVKPNFWAYIRLDLICTRPETLEILYDIGVRFMYFGIETLHKPTGNIIGKGFDRSKQIKMIEHIKTKYKDVFLHGSFIVGLPEESVDQFYMTVKQLDNREILLDSWSVHPLRLIKDGNITFTSEFEKNYTKFGYEDQGSDNSTVINWKNKFMTWDIAKEIAKECSTNHLSSVYSKMQGSISIELSTYGLDPDVVASTFQKDFDFNKVETVIRPNFINEYKSKLLNLIKTKALHNPQE